MLFDHACEVKSRYSRPSESQIEERAARVRITFGSEPVDHPPRIASRPASRSASPYPAGNMTAPFRGLWLLVPEHKFGRPRAEVDNSDESIGRAYEWAAAIVTKWAAAGAVFPPGQASATEHIGASEIGTKMTPGRL